MLLFESSALDKKINLMFNGQPLSVPYRHEEIVACFDKEKIQKVLTNLMSNAIKFTPEQGEISVNIGYVKSSKENRDDRGFGDRVVQYGPS